jgi:hypothetical protein
MRMRFNPLLFFSDSLYHVQPAEDDRRTNTTSPSSASTRSRGPCGGVISLSSRPPSHNGQESSQRYINGAHHLYCNPFHVPHNHLTPPPMDCEHQSFSGFPVLFPAYTSARGFPEDSHQLASGFLDGRLQEYLDANSHRVSHGVEIVNSDDLKQRKRSGTSYRLINSPQMIAVGPVLDYQSCWYYCSAA